MGPILYSFFIFDIKHWRLIHHILCSVHPHWFDIGSNTLSKVKILQLMFLLAFKDQNISRKRQNISQNSYIVVCLEVEIFLRLRMLKGTVAMVGWWVV